MNCVWTSIALRVPCTQARAKPFLQLFGGYAKSRIRDHGKIADKSIESPRFLGTTSWLAAKRKSAKTPAAPKYNNKPPVSAAQSSRRQQVVNQKQTPKPITGAPPAAAPEEVEVEELTWRDYDAEGGMPLPGRESDLSQSEIDNIFGTTPKSVDQEMGNYVLKVLHWRRMSGALIDVGLKFPKWTEASEEQIMNGLWYVRQLLPEYDETAAGSVWAEEESWRQAEVLRARAVKLGIYKDLDEEPMTEEPMTDEEKREAEEFAEKERVSEQGTEEGRERVGDSVLVRMRKQNEARWKAEQAEKAARKEREEIAALHSQRGPLEMLGGVQPSVDLVKVEKQKTWLPAKRERSAWIKKYEEKAMLSTDGKVPDLSTLRRLGPPFVVLLAALAAAYWLAENYTPAPRSARMFPDVPVSIATLSALTLTLLTTFVLFRVPPMWRFANKYFTLVPAVPYAMSLVGCLFRHDTLVHLASNVASLWVFGYLLHTNKDYSVDRGIFLAILLASGAIGCYTSLVYNVFRANWPAYVTGSSAAVAGVVAAVCVFRPQGNLHVPFTDWVIPYVAWVYLGSSVLLECFALLSGMNLRVGRFGIKVKTRQTNVDHAGHLGGLVTGIGAAWWLMRRREEGRGQEGGKGRDGAALTVETKAVGGLERE